MYSFLLQGSKNLPFFHSQSLQCGEKDFGISLKYLGTAGFILQSQHRTAVIDPFLTRPSLATTLTQKLRPNEELLTREIPHADDVLVGHSHFDHILDAPSICKRTGARFIGSPSSCNVARAAGVQRPQIVETTGREWIECGHNRIKGLPSEHGKVYFNRVTLPGNIPHIPKWPTYFWNLKHGLVLNWYLEYNRLGNPTMGRQSFKNALSINSNTNQWLASSISTLGGYYRDKRMYRQSLSSYQEVIELEPNNADAYLGIGLTYWNMDEKDLAISSWKKSMRIKPENNESQGWLILSEQGS